MTPGAGRNGRVARLNAARPLADRYELVFVLLLLTFVLGSFSAEAWTRLPALALYLAALFIALRSAQLTGTVARRLRLALGVGSVLVGVVVVVLPGAGTQGLLACWVGVVLLTTIGVIVRRILHHRAVTMQTIFGALSAYLLLGFFFAAVYTATSKLGPSPFFAGGKAATPASVQYFSFITLSTTGYGDYTAQNDAGRSMAVLEAVLGQVFLVTLVARLVAMYGMVRPSGPGRPRAPDDAATDTATERADDDAGAPSG